MNFLIVIVALFALMWLFMIRPQRKRQLQQSQMIDSLAAGDEIVTAGGVYGRVVSIADGDLEVEIAAGVVVRVAKRAVAGTVAQSTAEDEEEDEPADDEDEEPEDEEEDEEPEDANGRRELEPADEARSEEREPR